MTVKITFETASSILNMSGYYMQPLSSYIGEELFLIQPSFFKREYEFISSTEKLAKMYFPKFLSQKAIIEGFSDKYEIFRPKLWKSEIAIRKFAYELPFASLTTNFFKTKGKITLQNGKIVNLKFGIFKKLCEIFSESGELLVQINNQFSLKERNIVTINKADALIDENPWIIMMIWYLLIESKKSGAGA